MDHRRRNLPTTHDIARRGDRSWIGLPLKRLYEREPVDLDELDMRAAFAVSDATPLAGRVHLQISRSLDRCIRLRRALRSARVDDIQLSRVLKAEQRALALLRRWASSERAE